MALYDVSVGSLPQASDVNQLADIFNGKHDVGQITFAPQLSAPSTTGVSLTTLSGSTLGVGTYNYYLTYLTGYYKSDGTLLVTGETTVAQAVSLTTTANNTTIKITLPTSGLPASAIAFNIYRSTVGASSPLWLATVKSGTAYYTDSTADSSLGGPPPSTNTTGTKFGGTFATAKNTLDDGSGNMIFAGQTFKFTNTVSDGQFVASAGKNIGFTNNADNGWLLRANESTHALYSWNNTLDDGNGNMTLSSAFTLNGGIFNFNAPSASGGWARGFNYQKHDGSAALGGIGMFGSAEDTASEIYLGFGTSPWTEQGGSGLWIESGGGVKSTKNTLDDGSGNMTIAGAVVAASGNSNFHIIPAAGGNIGFTNNAANQWALRVSDSATPAAYTYKNTLDDGTGKSTFNGNMTMNGVITFLPQGTATSTTNYISNYISLQNSTWNGTSAVTNVRNVYLAADNAIRITNVGAASDVFIVDSSGNLTAAGNITAGVLYNRPYATATSGSNQGSAGIQFQNSTWNGTTAVTNYRNFYMDGNGTFTFSAYSGSPAVATIDTSGNLNVTGNITVKGNPIGANFLTSPNAWIN